MDDQVNPGRWIGLACLTVAAITAVFLVDGLTPWVASDRLLAVRVSLVCLSGVAVVLGVSTVTLYVHWYLYHGLYRDTIRRNNEAITPRILELRAAATLRPDQVNLVPALGYRAEMELVAGDEPRLFLRCPGGAVPLDWAVDYIRDSGVTELRAIRTYADRTPGREYARLVTDWCIERGLATPDEGPHPARWINEHSKTRALNLMGYEGEAR